jgi:hypothetical protein
MATAEVYKNGEHVIQLRGVEYYVDENGIIKGHGGSADIWLKDYNILSDCRIPL